MKAALAWPTARPVRPAGKSGEGGRRPPEQRQNYNRCIPINITMLLPWSGKRRGRRKREGEDDDALVSVSAEVVYIDAEEHRTSLACGASVHENGRPLLCAVRCAVRNWSFHCLPCWLPLPLLLLLLLPQTCRSMYDHLL